MSPGVRPNFEPDGAADPETIGPPSRDVPREGTCRNYSETWHLDNLVSHRMRIARQPRIAIGKIYGIHAVKLYRL